MIKFLSLYLLLVPAVLYAGTPDEDYVIDVIRDTFKIGETPTSSRLMPGGLWVCGLYDTIAGHQTGTVGVTLGGAKFKTTFDGIVSATPYYRTDIPYKKFNGSLMSYRLEDGIPKYYHFIRDVNEGIIIERAYVSKNVTIPSVIMPELQVRQYTYCLPYDESSNRKKVFNKPWERIPKF